MVIVGDRRKLARNGRRPAAPPGEVRHVQRDGLRFRRQALAADPVGKGAAMQKSRQSAACALARCPCKPLQHRSISAQFAARRTAPECRLLCHRPCTLAAPLSSVDRRVAKWYHPLRKCPGSISQGVYCCFHKSGALLMGASYSRPGCRACAEMPDSIGCGVCSNLKVTKPQSPRASAENRRNVRSKGVVCHRVTRSRRAQYSCARTAIAGIAKQRRAGTMPLSNLNVIFADCITRLLAS
jgi:hypothetical protein